MPTIQHRMHLVARSLRLIAAALDNVHDIRQLRGIILSLNNSSRAVMICAYGFQKLLIERSKFDIDPRENYL